MSDRERDLGHFLSDLHKRLREVETLEVDLRQKQAALAAREKQVALEWEKRESAKLKELERRTEQMLAKFDEQAQQTIGEIMHGVEQRKAAEQAQRRVAKTKREFREEFRTTVLSTQDESRHGDLRRPEIQEGVRVRLQGT